jgi:hypothetical protein
MNSTQGGHEEEDVPLKGFPKLAFYWSASATAKLILESLRKLTARSWREAAVSGATKLDRTMTWR